MRGGTWTGLRRAGALAAAGVAGLASGACDEETLAAVTARFQAEPDVVDFGIVALGQEEVRTVELSNRGAGSGVLGPVELDDPCDCFFVRTEVEGRRLEPGQLLRIQVAFRAVQEAPVEATLRLGDEDPEQPREEVVLRGAGRDDRRPAIEVDPRVLDFGGPVPAGGTAVDSFTIRSVGDADLLVDRIGIEPPGSAFRITTSTPTAETGPGRLPPGTGAPFSLRARVPEGARELPPTEVVIDTNVLEVLDDPEVPGRVRIPITTRGNRPPVAVISASDPILPFTRIQLDGSESFDPDDPPDLPLTHRWTLLQVPPGSQARIQSQSAVQTQFLADLSGDYVVELEVRDALGTPGRVVRTLSAVPDEGVRIELFWDHPDSDVDLHVIRDGGAFCDCGTGEPGAATDVHYRCRTANWYPDAPEANPEQDVDDQEGFGPEVTLLRDLDDVPSDRWILAVHYFDDAEETSSFPTTTSNATVRVFFDGLLVAEFDQALTRSGQLWEVGAVDWPSGDVQVSGRIVEEVECGFF